MGEILIYGENFSFFEAMSKNLLFFSEMVGRGRFRLFRRFLFG
jgi:hypothetical protein